MFGIVNSDEYLNQTRGTWKTKAVFYIGAAAIVGILSGTLLGLLGAYVTIEIRAASAVLAASAGIVIGAFELWRRPVRVIQINRETPQSWMRSGALAWATRNGAVLGLGATTRIGFWLWYSIPLGSFLVGSPAVGAAIYGTYSVVRAAWAIALIVLGSPNRTGSGRLADWLTSRIGTARTVSAAHMLALGIALSLHTTF